MAIDFQGKSLFEAVGGRPTLEKVHKIFYDKIYADNWIGNFFKEIKQELIENQQTDFMVSLMGGPDKYLGKFPKPAHQHMFITEELFDYRTELLKQSLQEASVKKEHAEAWLKLDGAFKKVLVKSSISECKLRYTTDKIVIFEKPRKKKAG
jgi:hemoglobin